MGAAVTRKVSLVRSSFRALLLAMALFPSYRVASAEPSPLSHLAQIRAATSVAQWCSPLDPLDLAKGPPNLLEARHVHLSPPELFEKVHGEFSKRGISLSPLLIVETGPFANAFIRRESEIVVTTPLLHTVLDTSELAFIFAHEMAHIALHHSADDSIRNEIAADELALTVVTDMGYNPCAGAEVLDRLAAPLSASLVSVSPRLEALHESSPDSCG